MAAPRKTLSQPTFGNLARRATGPTKASPRQWTAARPHTSSSPRARKRDHRRRRRPSHNIPGPSPPCPAPPPHRQP
eukprot:156415-Alexandrium_andersonii.AAC.1